MQAGPVGLVSKCAGPGQRNPRGRIRMLKDEDRIKRGTEHDSSV